MLARTALAGLEYLGINPPAMEPEHRLMPQLVKQGDTALDIGANVGAYTCQFSRLVGPSGRVVAFEAYPPTFSHLSALARFLALSNVTLRNVAITDSRRTVRFASARPAFGGTMHGFVHETTVWSPQDRQVEGRTLDEEVEEIGLRKVNLIKCDIEGGEAAMINGGQNTLQRHRPIVVCEIEERWTGRYGQHRSEVIDHLRELGRYEVFSTAQGRLIPLAEDLSSGNNVVFLPRP